MNEYVKRIYDGVEIRKSELADFEGIAEYVHDEELKRRLVHTV